jgi:hypothetical protein
MIFFTSAGFFLIMKILKQANWSIKQLTEYKLDVISPPCNSTDFQNYDAT